MGCPTAVLAGSVSSLGGLVFGYELGIISGALQQLKVLFQLGCVRQEALVSSLLMGAVFASLVGGWLIDRRGRRYSITLSGMLVMAGTGLQVTGGFFGILVVGRAVTGFAICISSMSCCIFVSEMVAPKRRGLMVTLYEVGITVGILAAYVFNYLLSNVEDGWRYMFGVAMVPTMFQLLLIWFLRSTPAVSGADGRARKSRRGLADQADSAALMEEQQQGVERESYGALYLFQGADNMRMRTCIGLGLVLSQQFTGQPNLLLYASTVFHTLGFQKDNSSVLATLGLGVVKVVGTLVSVVCADRIGRRPLLIGGSIVMAIGLLVIGSLSSASIIDAVRPCSSFSTNDTPSSLSMAPPPTHIPIGHLSPLVADQRPSLGVSLQGHPPTTPTPSSTPGDQGREAVGWVILTSMMAVVGAFSLSFGPMTWLVLSEIFPAGVRGRAFAFINCFNWTANLLVTFSFLNVIDAIGMSGAFLAYGVVAFISAFFIHVTLPETKGKSLQDIDRELSEKRFHKPMGSLSQHSSPAYQRVTSISSSNVESSLA